MEDHEDIFTDIKCNDTVIVTASGVRVYYGAADFIAIGTCTEQLAYLYQKILPDEKNTTRFRVPIGKYKISIPNRPKVAMCVSNPPINGEYQIFKLAKLVVNHCFARPTVTICLGTAFALTTYADINFIKWSIDLIYRCCRDIPVFELLSICVKDGPTMHMRGGTFPLTQTQLYVYHLFSNLPADCKEQFDIYGAGPLDAEILYSMMPRNLTALDALRWYAEHSRELQRRVLASLMCHIPYFSPMFTDVAPSIMAFIPNDLSTVDTKEDSKSDTVMVVAPYQKAPPIRMPDLPVIRGAKPLNIGEKSAFKKLK